MRSLLAFLIACTPRVTESKCAPRPALDLGFAVAHVAGVYPKGTGQLGIGAEAVQKLGAKTIKVYLTPSYAEKYRETWGSPKSLVELAQTPQFVALLQRPFVNFVITTYTFANGVDGGFIDGFDALEQKSEYAELRALAEHLLRTYKRTGKRFILQNWEGDWAARGSFDKAKQPTATALAGMRAYLQARQAAISDARDAVGERGVRIDNAAEVNALLDDTVTVANEVLPNLCLDAVSYSSWEALAPLYTGDAPLAVDKLKRALSHLRTKTRAHLYLGELGIAENDLKVPLASFLPALLLAADADIVWWQIYDNECDGARCRGHGLLRPDNSRSPLLDALTH